MNDSKPWWDLIVSYWGVLAAIIGVPSISVGTVFMFRWIWPLKISLHDQCSYYTYVEKLCSYVIVVPRVEVTVRRSIFTRKAHLELKAIKSFYPIIREDLNYFDERQFFDKSIVEDMIFKTFTSHEEDLQKWLGKDSRARIVIGRCKSN